MSSTTTSYWCYRCTRFVTVLADNDHHNNGVTCPNCDGGFIEEIQANPQPDNPHRRFMYMISNNNNGDRRQDSDQIPTLRFRRARRNAGDRSPFNPVVVLRGAAEENNEGGGSSYEFYYDDGTGSGLRPVPATMSEFLMGSGFDRLLEQLAQIEVNGLGRGGNPPASKAVVESMPTVEIEETHIVAEAHCAVCKEAFELGNEVREMPCKHIYHGDCILPWLAMRNSCPVCRHELPADQQESENGSEEPAAAAANGGGEEDIVGLTIWRLPGGGFAVGRFRGGEREFPGVFTEMDGGFSGAQRRVSWVGRRSRGTHRGGRGSGNSGLGRVFRGLVSFFRRSRSNNNNNNNNSSSASGLRTGSESGSSISRSSSHSSSGFGRFLSVRSRWRGLDLEVENGNDRW